MLNGKTGDKFDSAQILELPEFRKLNKFQIERIKYLLNNPGGEELVFFAKLAGKTPAQAMHLMAGEYLERFDSIFNAEELKERLTPCLTWVDLDLAIRNFAVTLHRYYEMMIKTHIGEDAFTEKSKEWEAKFDLELDFWDRMRYLVEALPKLREFNSKYTSKAVLRKKGPKRGWDFETCELCWRTVPVNKDLKKKTAALCFEHDLQATDAVYRKHKRLLESVHDRYRTILVQLKTCFPLHIPDDKVKEVMTRILTTRETPLPRLVEHLEAVGHTGEAESLIHAFHGPFPPKIAAIYREAMNEFFQEALSYPYLFTLDELALAEAWLTALQTDRRRKK